ncbi:MAG: TorF family putative porin [Sphingopyxis sp.]
MKIVATTICATATALIALATPAMAQDGAASGIDVSASVSAATDYRWRGVSQTDVNPAVFASVQAKSGGFYVGAGTENVDFAGINQEYDLWAGYAMPLGRATLDVGVVRYGYVDAPADIDTTEVKIGLSAPVGSAGVGVTAYHTGNYFGSNNSATYVEASANAPVNDAVTVSAAVGRQQISNMADYTTWNIGASYKVLPGAQIDLRYHDTDTSAFGRNGRGRVVGSFSLSF